MRTTVTNPTKVAAGERDGPRIGHSTPVRHEPRPAVSGHGTILAQSTGTGPAEGDGGTTNRTRLEFVPKAPVIQRTERPRGLAAGDRERTTAGRGPDAEMNTGDTPDFGHGKIFP